MKEFSERENKIIKIIGRKKTTIQEISDELFKDEPNTLDAETKVSSSINRIIRKCEYHSLSWTLLKKRRNGSVIKDITRVKIKSWT